MKTCGNRNYRKWLALMVSGGLAVTALAGCGGAMEEQSRARRQRSRRGLRRRQKIIR